MGFCQVRLGMERYGVSDLISSLYWMCVLAVPRSWIQLTLSFRSPIASFIAIYCISLILSRTKQSSPRSSSPHHRRRKSPSHHSAPSHHHPRSHHRHRRREVHESSSSLLSDSTSSSSSLSAPRSDSKGMGKGRRPVRSRKKSSSGTPRRRSGSEGGSTSGSSSSGSSSTRWGWQKTPPPRWEPSRN